MNRFQHAVAAMAAVVGVASFADAQGRERPRQTDANYGQMIRESAVGLRLSNRDVEDMSPVKLLADKRKDLKLTDDQQAQLKAISESLKETNKPHFAALDSLRNEFRPRVGVDPEIERVRTQIVRETVVGAVRVIRQGYLAASAGALALLDDAQNAKATELMAKHAKESEETLAEKLGSGRGGAPGGSGGRGRPPASP